MATIDVEDVLAKLTDKEKIDLLSGNRICGDQKRLKNRPRSLHQIVHCCLSVVADLRTYGCMPSSQRYPTLTGRLRTDDEKRLWLNSVFLPTLYAEHKGEERVLQHFPASYEVAQANALSHGTERTVFDYEMHISRQQLLNYIIRPEKPAGIWDRVRATIEDSPALANHPFCYSEGPKTTVYKHVAAYCVSEVEAVLQVGS
jgi:hypothetical protein